MITSGTAVSMYRASTSHVASAIGASTAVSLASTARQNQNAVTSGLSSKYAVQAQKVSPAAAKSTCAKELCAKNTGYKAVHTVAAIATLVLATSSASRKTPSN